VFFCESPDVVPKALDVEVGRRLFDHLQEGFGQHPEVYHRRGRSR